MADEESQVTPPKKRGAGSPGRSPERKRKRVQAEYYQSDVVDVFSRTAASRTPTATKEVFFNKGAFLAVRSSEVPFYLCQTNQNVFTTSKIIKIRWLEIKKAPDLYTLLYNDTVDLESVLTEVKLTKKDKNSFIIAAKEIKRVEKIIELAIKKENGELNENDVVLNKDLLPDDDDDDEEEEEEKKPANKRRRKQAKAPATKKAGARRGLSRGAVKPKPKASASLVSDRLKNKAKRRLSAVKQTKSKAKPTKSKSNARKQVKTKGKKVVKKAKEKKEKQPKIKKHPNQLLTQNTKIEVVMKDPCFEIKAENEMPDVSSVIYAKRAIRAVLTNDMPLLRRLIGETKKVSSLFLPRSADVDDDAMSYAIMNNNHVAIKLLAKEMTAMEKDHGRRCSIPENIIQTQSTGTYKFRTLGHATKAISMSRGSKEGNNAFTKENHEHGDSQKYSELALKCGASKATVDVLTAMFPDCQGECQTYIAKAVREGHRKVAAHFIQQSVKAGGCGFNFLHHEVLTCSHPDELTKFRSVSVKKKPYDNDCATPLHFAAINPNPKILAKLLDSQPEYSLPDKTNKKPIHYAAACEGSGPLELLLNKFNVNPDETDNQNTTPLMVAARTGRIQNVEVLMRKINANIAGEKSGLHRRGPAGKTPLHFAAENGHTDAVKALVKHGADIQAILNAGNNRQTALMLACKKGHFTTAKALVELNAIIEKKDKLQKTALMHAVINGHYKIVCYLLRKGADPNTKDSSGNTLVHYAAAYGWWYCLRVLLKAGGSPNTPNDWKIPPLGIAIMTSNRGCADLLLEQDEVDINFKDDNGYTLITYLVTSPLTGSVLDDLKHLVEDLKARVDQTDINGWTALHHLTEQDVISSIYNQRNNPGPSRQQISIELVEMLLKYGCPLSAKTDNGKTAVNLAIEQEKCNIELIQLLVKKGCTISLSTNKEKETILHTMVNRCKENDVASLIKILGDRLQKNSEDCTDGSGGDNNDGGGGTSMRSLAQLTDNNGLTPFTKCVYEYYKLNSPQEKIIISFENMMMALVDVGGSDVNQSIQDATDGRQSNDGPFKYKQSPVQMLAACNQPSLTAASSGRDVAQPLLNLLLGYKPNLDSKDGKGRTPLIIAILNKNVEAAKLIIKSGANINIASDDLEDDGKATPLVLAARYSQFELLHLLLSKGASVTAIDEKNKKTALHYVASSSKTASEVVAIVRALTRKKANINALDEHKRTPLHLAVNANEGGTNATAEVVEVLLEHNANVFAKDADDCLPLHYAFSKIDRLDDNSQMDPIEMATTIIESMKRNQLNSQNVRGQTPLHLAAYRGASISAMYIVERIQDYEVRDKFRNTPLATALLGGYDSMCIMLIQKGANININVTEVTKEMLSPPKKEEAEKAKKFWQWKPTVTPPDKPTTMSFFRSALEKNWQGVCYLVMDRLDRFKMMYVQAVQYAFEAFKYQMALTMIRKQKEPQKLMTLNKRNQNLLHLLCLNAPSQESPDLQVQVADMLSKRGLDFSRKDTYSCTAVTYAAAAQNKPLIDFFFKCNNDKFDNAISALDSTGRLPMAALFYCPNFDETTKDLIKLFMKCGGSLNIRSPVPYVDPAIAKYLPQPKSLSEVFHGASDRNIDQTPLIHCIRNGRFNAVNFLLKNNADPNYPDKDMVTPLMHAVKKNDDDIVRLLLNHSFTIKKKNDGTGRNARQVGGFGYLNWGRKKMAKVRGNQSLFYGNTYDDSDEEDEASNSDDGEDNDEDDDNVNEEDEDKMDDDEDSNKEEDMDVDEDKDEDMENGIDEDEGNEENEKPKRKKKESKKKTEVFEMTSSVNLKATDSKARNVIHHVVKSSEEGTFCNVEMLELLVRVGASLDQTDANGKTPLDYAITVRSSEMTTAIQKLKKVAEKNMVKPEVLKLKWSDNIQWQADKPDFKEDSKKMLQKLEEENTSKEPDDKPSATVDANSDLTEGGVVLIDPEQNIPYNAIMTKVEVRYGLQGMNNFYKLQVIHQKGKDVYALFTRWGMIGDDGQFQCTPFSTKDEAVKEFLKVFRAKTGNSWSNVKNFEKQPKKYRLVKAEPFKSKRIYKEDKNPSFNSKVISKLPSRVRDVMTSLTNHKMYEASMRCIKIDTNYMPTAMISREVLMDAKKILVKVRDNLKECERLRNENLLQEIEKFQRLMDEVNDLSNEFYELIPHINFSYQNTSPLTNDSTLKEAVELVCNLLDYEVASKVILGARFKQQDVNPLDYVYRTLDCQMQLLNEESGEAQRILRYIHNTKERENIKVEGIFRANRSGEEERLYNNGVGNHMLLWHGTGTANLISILKRGLLVAPPEAPSTGYMFGKGIYFADTFSKSANYCYSHGDDDSKWMLLCEVALGKACHIDQYTEFNEDKHVKNFDSVQGKGSSYPNPAETIHLPQGSKIPLGEIMGSGYSYLNFNEFIVYDSSQVCLRYLVQFKMD